MMQGGWPAYLSSLSIPLVGLGMVALVRACLVTRQPVNISLRRLPLCCLLLVGACVQGPDYVKPTVAVPSTYRFSTQHSGTPDQESAWWNGFRDRKLDALVVESLANNRDL